MESSDLQSDLLRSLGAWSAISVIGGAALWAAADHRGSVALRAFARQQIAWGGIDGAIAAAGALRQHRGAGPQQDPERLRRILRINAVLDVGYVACGAAMVALRGRLGSRSGYSQEQALGDGLGIMVQGGFLALLDATHATR